MTAAEKSVRIISTYDVEGIPDVAAKYTKATVLRPIRVTIASVDGEPWSAVAEGPNVKKDGSTGQNWHDRHWGFSRYDDALPDEIAAIVAEHMAKHWGQS